MMRSSLCPNLVRMWCNTDFLSPFVVSISIPFLRNFQVNRVVILNIVKTCTTWWHNFTNIFLLPDEMISWKVFNAQFAKHLNWKLGELRRALLACWNGNLSWFPVTRASTSVVFATDVKEETQLDSTVVYLHLNSSLVMSLGAGAWRVSGWPDATSREEISMATLEAGTTPKAATNRHRHTEKENFSGDTYPWEYLPENYLRNHQPPGREGGEGARIRNAWPKRNNWSATISKQSNNAV